jgi:hypothetical protein
MEPFWFKAAKVTDVGVPVRLAAIAAVMVSVARLRPRSSLRKA